MPDSTPTVTTAPVSGADADVISTLYPIPGLGFVPINAYLLHAQEPVLVDTGPVVFRDLYLDALRSLIDIEDLRWIYLTHADPDHVGCLHEVLAAAPNARLITTFLGLGRLGLYGAMSPDRVFLLNPGQRISVGDRELRAIVPPTFDAPDTTGFVDSRTGVLFSSDSFGAVLPEPVECLGELSDSALREGVITWATIDSPWLGGVEPATFARTLNRTREIAAPIVLSSHLPPAFDVFDVLLGHVEAAHGRPRFIGPDQAELMAMLSGAPPQAPAEHHAQP